MSLKWESNPTSSRLAGLRGAQYNTRVMKNKKYELTIMVKSDVKDEAREKLVEKLEKTVKALEGKVVKTMEMGKKQLAYKISGQSEATFMNLVLELPPLAVIQLDKKLTVDKEILRHLLVVA